jgi:hypothetical protein
MNLAPIALFTYNRFWHIQRTVEALQRNVLATDSELFVFSDGPKTEEDRKLVELVREYLQTITGFRNVTIIARDKNLGLAQSIIAGVTEITRSYGRIIILEDDMVTSPYFLQFMNEALEFYKDEEKVISIHGYVYPVKAQLPETFFLKGADCWGWATWNRGWDLFERDGNKLLSELKERSITRGFDFDGSYPYTKQLSDQVRGKNNSWAIRWYASAFLRNKLTLYPGRSLVQNIGFDSSGAHCETTDAYSVVLSGLPVPMTRIAIEENAHARKAIGNFIKTARPCLSKKLTRIIKKLTERMNLRGRKNIA